MRPSLRRRLWPAAVALVASLCAGAPALAAPASGQLTYAWSDALVGAFNAASLRAEGLDEASRVVEDLETGAIFVEGPIASADIGQDEATQALTLRSVRSPLAFKLGDEGTPPGWKGGSSVRPPAFLRLRNLEVDFAERAIYADIDGDHGVGQKERVRMWRFSSAQASVVAGPQPDTLIAHSEIAGLTVTDEGFQMLVQAMRLTPTLGIPSFRNIGDHGVIRTTLLVDTRVVPEPASCASMGLGLVGIALLRRGRRRPLTSSNASTEETCS